ncbi:hypothetical protein CcaCcLH18_07877 [Colletotrichum camelliae]|nr:hypothetical protein CcaCcLH18_07877 [Colletotrichum camelliae]
MLLVAILMISPDQTSPRDYDSLNQLSTLRQRTRRIGKTHQLKLKKEYRARPQGFASKMDTAKYIQRLQNDSDWTKWFNSLRMVATVHDVWDYINPDQAVVNTKPQPNYSDDVSLANFSNLLNLEKAKFELRESEYRRVQQSLNDVLKWIISTVDAQHMNQVSRHSSLRDMVKSLKDNLAPSSQARQELVKRRYILHLESIKRQNIIDWLNTYLDIMEEARVLDIISMSDPREQVRDFLRAVKTVAPDWATPEAHQMAKKTLERPKKGERWHGAIAASEFRNWIRSEHPDWLEGKTKTTSFATWQGRNEEDKKVRKFPSDWKPECPACPGQKHFAETCAHFNPAIRKSTYNPNVSSNKRAIEKAQNFLKNNPRVRTRIETFNQKNNIQTTITTSSHFTQDGEDSDGSLSSSYFNEEPRIPAASLFSGSPLRNSVIVDSGSSYHICNNLKRMRDLDYSSQQQVLTGGGHVTAIAKGTMVVKPNRGGPHKKGFIVRSVLYIPDYPVSLLGTEPLKKIGLFFTVRHPGLEDSKGELLFKTPWQHGQYLLDYVASEESTSSISNTPMEGISKDECVACSTGKAMQRVSRRKPDHNPTAPGDYISMDFFVISKAYNNEKVIILIRDEWSGFTWIRGLRARKEGLQALSQIVAFLERQYSVRVSIIRLDWDTALRSAFDLWAATEGYLIQRSADYTGAQNPAERAGGIIFMIVRALRFQSRFPEELGPELIRAAVYLGNRMPRKRHNWQTPEGVVNSWLNSRPDATHRRPEMPQMAHLRRYGCRAYPLTVTYKSGQQKSNKTEPRAHVGYLCGYDSTNIYRIWIPALNKVMRTRDVTFDESKLYDPREEDISMLHKLELEKQFNQLEIPFPDPISEELPMDSALWESDHPHQPLVTVDTGQLRKEINSRGMVTPEESIELGTDQLLPQTSPAAEGVEDQEEDQETTVQDIHQEPTPDSNNFQTYEEGEEILPTTEVATQDETKTSSQLGRRGRPAGRRNNNIYNREVPIGQINHQPESATRSSRRLKQSSQKSTSFFQSTDSIKDKDQWDSSAQGLGSVHRKDLPKPPSNWVEAKSHPYWPKWLAAMNIENRAVWRNGTFELSRLEDVNRELFRILPLKWVFTYKTNKHGYLVKFKARICAERGQCFQKGQADGKTTRSIANYARCCLTSPRLLFDQTLSSKV